MKTIVITCFKYQQVAEALRRNLETQDIQAIYLTDARLPSPVEQVICGETLWARRVAAQLRQLNDDYVLLLLDDYFVLNSLSDRTKKTLADFLSLQSPDYVRLVNVPSRKLNATFELLDSNCSYQINLQAAVWKRNVLILLLEAASGNPWQTEVRLQRLMLELPEGLSRSFVMRTELSIYNGVIKGKWQRDYRKKLARYLSPSSSADLPVMCWHEQLSYNLRASASALLRHTRVRATVKRVLMFFGMHFYSEEQKNAW